MKNKKNYFAQKKKFSLITNAYQSAGWDG